MFNQDFFKKNKLYILAAILVVSTTLIFFNLTRADIQHDDATYAFRSVGYLDFMNAANNQTTPFQWFDTVPWWSHLSFHDHPPLVFIIQHLFFLVFGSSDFVARLPFALAGVASVLVLYFLAKELYHYCVGLLASLILAISSYHTWASRVGYLESFATLLVLLTLLIFAKSLRQSKYLYLGGLLLGLSILTKYTVVFIIPAALIYLWFKKREYFFSIHLYWAALVTVITISPLLVYNYMMFKTRGHFDLQLSLLFNQSRADWPGISRGVGGLHLDHLIKVLFNSYSIFVLTLAAMAFVYFVVKLFFKAKTDNNLLLLLTLFFGILLFSFIYPEVRLLSLLNPFVALLVSLVIFELFVYFHRLGAGLGWQRQLLAAVIILVLSFELFYNINTNLLNQPFGQPTKLYSVYRWESGGFNNLNQFLLDKKLVSNAQPLPIRSLIDVMPKTADFSGQDIFIYEPDLNWFSTLWYFARYQIYNKYNFVSAITVNSSVPADKWLETFKLWGIRDMYYIAGKNNVVVSSDENKAASAFLENGIANLATQTYDVFNNIGKPAFKIYQIKIN